MSTAPAVHPLRGPIAAPSILSADVARLAEEIAIVDPGREWLHCDVMDHHFVPNLTFGPMLVEAVSRLTPAFLDVHLMVEHPERMAAAFRRAGAHQITVHLEACADPAAVLDGVRATGARVGLALKPGTPFAAAVPWLGRLDLLLVMTVEPGFGGQAFMEDMLPKVREARLRREGENLRYLIEVDGGIGPGTARRYAEAGADVFVAGNAIFHRPDPRAALAGLRAEIG